VNRLRRTVLAFGAAAIANPSAVLGQAQRRRIAWLSSARGASSFAETFKDSLRQLGYQEGRDIEIATYFTDGTPGRTEKLAREAIAAGPELIVSQGVTVRALYDLKPQMPVVFAFSGDPVDAGFVQSLARPGGNMTGMTFLSLELVGKRMQYLTDLLPGLKRVAVLANPQHSGESSEREASQKAAGRLGLEITYLPVTTVAEIEPALLAARKARCEAVDVYPDSLMASQAARIGEITAREKLPSISG